MYSACILVCKFEVCELYIAYMSDSNVRFVFIKSIFYVILFYFVMLLGVESSGCGLNSPFLGIGDAAKAVAFH